MGWDSEAMYTANNERITIRTRQNSFYVQQTVRKLEICEHEHEHEHEHGHHSSSPSSSSMIPRKAGPARPLGNCLRPPARVSDASNVDSLGSGELRPAGERLAFPRPALAPTFPTARLPMVGALRFEAVLAPGQSVVLSSPRGAGAPPDAVEISRRADSVVVRKAAAALTN